MSFDDEWAQLVSAAKERQSAGTRLNQSGGGGFSGARKSNLNVTPSVLRARAGKLENAVIPDFKEAQKKARDRTSGVPGSMMGFSCDEALGDFIDRWDDQVKYLEETLGSKGLARALRSAADDFTTEEDVRKEEFDGMKRPYREGDII